MVKAMVCVVLDIGAGRVEQCEWAAGMGQVVLKYAEDSSRLAAYDAGMHRPAGG